MQAELGDGGGDVGELDDVGLGGLGEVAEFGEGVGELLLGGEEVGELGDDAPGEGDVAGFDVDAGGLREGLDDGQERVGGEGGRFVGVGVDDGGHFSYRLSVIGYQRDGECCGWGRRLLWKAGI